MQDKCKIKNVSVLEPSLLFHRFVSVIVFFQNLLYFFYLPLHNKSHNIPVSGISVGRCTSLICSNEVSSGDNPPCIHNILLSTTATTGNVLKQSVNVFHNLILYLLLHSS